MAELFDALVGVFNFNGREAEALCGGSDGKLPEFFNFNGVFAWCLEVKNGDLASVME